MVHFFQMLKRERVHLQPAASYKDLPVSSLAIFEFFLLLYLYTA